MAKYKVLRPCIKVSENNKAYGVGGIMELKDNEVKNLVNGGYIDAKPIGAKKPTKKK